MDDEQQIRAIIDDYFHGMYRSDTTRLSRAFHTDARINGWDEGKLIDAPIAKFIDFIGGVSAPADDGEAFDMEIISIDIADSAAAVKVKDLYKGLRFTDFLTLLRFDNGWRIVNKTFAHLPREKA
ncbi:MAG: nuclear transport factor 2 family protein [Rhodospirillaceae bacterium]|jgi:hypothetical protein|nr:nuclear transport factor 2 family protein [Rhodospirillaceae bacterium]